MPVTKTAKRALRSSLNKARINTIILSNLEAAVRYAKRSKTQNLVRKAISLTDRALKKRVIHKNKAARIKSRLSKLIQNKTKTPKKKAAKKTTTSK